MASDNVGIIDGFLNTFETTIDSGFGLVKGSVVSLAGSLSVLDIVLAGLFWAWAADEDIVQRLVKKTLYIGFFAFVIDHFSGLSGIVFNSFAALDLKAGGLYAGAWGFHASRPTGGDRARCRATAAGCGE